MTARNAPNRFQRNRQEEIDSASIYTAIAGVERSEKLGEVYRRVAASEEAHIAFWERKLQDAGARAPRRRPSVRARAVVWLAKRFGTRSGTLAGACAMAMGEWLSVQSARELAQRQIDIERDELREAPEEEQQELSLIYQAKGLGAEEADALAAKLMADKENVLDTLTREELGLDPEELGGSARDAAVTSFFLFVAGAIAPVTPFLFLSGAPAVITSLAVSGAALFATGAAITLLTGRGVLYSGGRQLLIGMGAAGVTFGIGRLTGVFVG